MKLFNCGTCGNVLFFENGHCVSCHHKVAFAADVLTLTDVERVEGGESEPEALFEARSAEAQGRRYRRCRNDIEYGACNWLIEAGDSNAYCASCRLNEVVPNLSDSEDHRAWLALEQAKRRLVYTLNTLGLPLVSRAEQPKEGLAFRFLRGTAETPVMTGHEQGVITLNIEEANSIFRENMRERLGEAYRTVLGHFRHEVGHYYWDRLVAPNERALARFRERFGDERQSYQDALTRHYEKGPPPNWTDQYISAYATMHPWEDWAETWAHYFHMVDTLETAASYGIAVQFPEVGGRSLRRRMWAVDFQEFSSLHTQWDALTLALNSLNRSMGLPDTYPFALSEPVYEKLRFVHQVILEASGGAREESKSDDAKPTKGGDSRSLTQSYEGVVSANH